ncbi:DUF4365 domain-containing protein [Nocardia sp. alder85J]|uniref:DUF4365 domain-containing protein n=1 Tax=Nocardia sp. alder85J TaxID=2862949 RepID=UPI001CD5CB6F|nr:DUF4365 domain-containing protein [Nocardia sp. alder85J]MCX4093198.1 DUF4365 domain-containing protein [Nocardia sp. alder85J]
MTLALSHEIPDGSMPIGGMKEELSMSYVSMLASSCGLTVGKWSQDYDGRDTTLASSVDYHPHMYGPQIDMQLKCSGQTSINRTDAIAWSLDTRTYDLLSKRNRSNPAMLCVLVVPEMIGHWLKADHDGLLARCQMYWQWGHLLPPLEAEQKTQTVHLPKENLLTPKSLLELMEEASKWQPAMASLSR